MTAPPASSAPNPAGRTERRIGLLGLNSAVECLQDAVVCLDLEGTILSWNRGAGAVYGYTSEEMVGRPISSLAPPERAQEEAYLLEQARAGQRVQHFETVRVRKNGIPIDVSVSISPVRQGESVVGATHVARSLSERKRLEAANAQLTAIIESSEDAIVSTDEDGIIRTWNAAAERVFGYLAKEAIGRTMNWLTPAERAEEDAEIVSKTRRGERIANLETLRLRRNGQLVHVSLTISPICDRQGKLLGASYIARETTERLRLEAANAQLAAVVESSEDAIVGKDLDGVISSWNAGAERVYGYSAGEAIGRNIAFLLPPGRADEEQEILATLRRGERVEHFETKRLRKDGRLIDVSLAISPIRDSAGRIVGASHTARDITERRSFELQMQQMQRLESLGVLAGGIAHDFNNLLTGVMGNASLIGEILPDEHPVRPLIQDVTTAAERAASLTAQLLAYSGKGQFVIGTVDIDRLVSEISIMAKATISKNVVLELDLGHGAPAVEGDRTQLHQLVMNLILNGAEAIGENRPGTVCVRTGTQFLDEIYIHTAFPTDGLTPGEYSYVEVRDDGCGMNEETTTRIFDPFFTTKFMGRGLGLAAALGIVHAHKGVIRVRSTPGQGSTFTVLLPASETLRGSKRVAAKGAVLVVDDEEIVCKTAKVCLERHGYRVLTAANGREAVERFREARSEISLVVLDLTMPVMGGEETLRQLRAAGARVPVVLSSGYTEEDARRRFSTDRPAGFVQKPYSSATLISKLDRVLRGG